MADQKQVLPRVPRENLFQRPDSKTGREQVFLSHTDF